MKKLFFPIFLGLSLFAMACVDSVSTSSQGGKQTTIIENVDVDMFKSLIAKNNGQIIDVRTPNEWATGIIKGAYKFNIFEDTFEKNINMLDKKKPVYVYCKSGGRSAKAAKKMKELGFQKIYNLKGGMNAWKQANNYTIK
ncbi:MAG: rhodanese-like domain-containing protein [Fusobacterium sp.]